MTYIYISIYISFLKFHSGVRVSCTMMPLKCSVQLPSRHRGVPATPYSMWKRTPLGSGSAGCTWIPFEVRGGNPSCRCLKVPPMPTILPESSVAVP